MAPQHKERQSPDKQHPRRVRGEHDAARMQTIADPTADEKRADAWDTIGHEHDTQVLDAAAILENQPG